MNSSIIYSNHPPPDEEIALLGGAFHLLACRLMTIALLFALPGEAVSAQIPFPAKHTVVTGFLQADAVFAADVDRDGDTDILGAAITSDQIAWWENVDGSGTNWIPHVIEAGFDQACDVAASDLDGDGDLDVAGAASAADDIAWWDNTDGTGTNWVRQTVDGSFDGARSIVLTDLDRDGDHDIVGAAFQAHQIAWWSNNDGTGTNWTKRIIGSNLTNAFAVTAGDVNGDGNVDVLGAIEKLNLMAWWENVDGNATNWIQHTISSTNFAEPNSVWAADINGDGKLDVAGAANIVDQISWWENITGAGTNWIEHAVDPSFNGARAVSAADLDADGDTDLLASAEVAHDVAWWENRNRVGTSWTKRFVDSSFTNAHGIFVADVDGDGDLDALGSRGIVSSGEISWWDNKTIHRSARFPAELVLNAGSADSVSIADLDADGHLDLLVAADDRIDWYRNDGAASPTFTTNTIDLNADGADSVVAADLNRDGAPDVIAASSNGHTVAWYQSDGALLPGFTKSVISSNALSARSVSAADLDRDGYPDVLSASFADNTIAWHRNLGGINPSFTTRVISATAQGARCVLAADLDRDGDPDVISGSSLDGRVAWYESDGQPDPAFVTNLISDQAGDVRTVIATDLDRDGDPDLLSVSSSSNAITWYRNDGLADPGFAVIPIDTNAASTRSIWAEDLDADGDSDIISASTSDNFLRWYENDGASNPVFIAQGISTNFNGARSLTVADLNADGKPDLAVAADTGLAWKPNLGGQFALTSTHTAASYVRGGETNVLFSISMAHRGRSADTDEELASLKLRWEENAGDPLTTIEATNLISRLQIYLDTGSGVFESGADTLVVNLTDLALVAGTQTVSFVDGDPLVQLVPQSSKTYFVVAELTTHAAQDTPHQFFITHLTEPSSGGSGGAEDRDFDIALTAESSSNLSAGPVTAIGDTDLALTKQGFPNPIILNSNLTYFLTVTNLTSAEAVSVTVTDALPAGVSFLPGLSSPECAEMDGRVTCALGTFTGNAVRVLTISVGVQGTTVQQITNLAMVTTGSTDTNPADNTAQALTFIPDDEGDGNPDFHDPDDDNDGMSDHYENLYGFNRTNPTDATLDGDVDTFNNVQEYIADTHPNDSNSFFRIEELIQPGPSQILFTSSVDRVYTLQILGDLTSNTWTDVPGQIDEPGNGALDSLLDVSATNFRVYRIQVEVPP